MQNNLFNKSLLQRLTNQTAENFDTAAFHEEIRIHLERILNTRLRYISLPVGLREIANSMLKYGITDFMNMNYSTEVMQGKLAEEIETVIKLFEPRAGNVNVSIENSSNNRSRILKLVIEIKVKSMEKAIYESSVDLNRHSFEFI